MSRCAVAVAVAAAVAAASTGDKANELDLLLQVLASACGFQRNSIDAVAVAAVAAVAVAVAVAAAATTNFPSGYIVSDITEIISDIRTTGARLSSPASACGHSL